jgi:hypothetical protein
MMIMSGFSSRRHKEGSLSMLLLPSFVLMLAVAGLSVFVTPSEACAEATSEPASLWYSAPVSPDPSPVQRKAWVLRERDIALDLQVLQILKNATARPHPRVTVEFFDANRHELDITSTVSRFNDTAVIRGSFKPPSRGDFTLVATGDLLIGSLQVGDRFYKTEHAGNGRLKLLEVDPRKMPPD